MNILEGRGLFWWHGEPLADRQFAPNSSVSGHLVIEKDGRASLELDGVLLIGERPAFLPLVGDDPAIQKKSIQGILKGGNQHVLLCEIRRDGGRLSSAGISYERYLADTCLVGETDVPGQDAQPQASGLVVNLKGFEEWLGLRSIDIAREREPESLSANYKKHDDIDYPLDSGKLSFRHYIDGPIYGKRKDHTLTLREVVLLYYTFPKNLALEDTTAQYRLLEDFLILLTDSEHSLDWPEILISSSDRTYRLYFWRDRNPAPAPGMFECWPNFPLIRDSLGRVFTNWKEKRDIFGPAFYLYLGTRRGQQAYTENLFVNLIWGIESFHRIKHPESASTIKLRERIGRILAKVAKPDVADQVMKRDIKWLIGKLKYAAEPPLETRIFEMIKSLPLGLEEARCRQFAKSCADRRNDLSHYGGQRTGTKYDEFVLDLVRKSHALAYLSHALILRELELGESIVKGYVDSSSKSYRIKSALVEVNLMDREVLKPTPAQRKPE